MGASEDGDGSNIGIIPKDVAKLTNFRRGIGISCMSYNMPRETSQKISKEIDYSEDYLRDLTKSHDLTSLDYYILEEYHAIKNLEEVILGKKDSHESDLGHFGLIDKIDFARKNKVLGRSGFDFKGLHQEISHAFVPLYEKNDERLGLIRDYLNNRIKVKETYKYIDIYRKMKITKKPIYKLEQKLISDIDILENEIFGINDKLSKSGTENSTDLLGEVMALYSKNSKTFEGAFNYFKGIVAVSNIETSAAAFKREYGKLPSNLETSMKKFEKIKTNLRKTKNKKELLDLMNKNIKFLSELDPSLNEQTYKEKLYQTALSKGHITIDPTDSRQIITIIELVDEGRLKQTDGTDDGNGGYTIKYGVVGN